MRTAFGYNPGRAVHVRAASEGWVGIFSNAFDGLDLIACGAWREQRGTGCNLPCGNARSCFLVANHLDLIAFCARRKQRLGGKRSECESGNNSNGEEQLGIHIFTLDLFGASLHCDTDVRITPPAKKSLKNC